MVKKLPIYLTVGLIVSAIVLLAIGMPSLNLNVPGKQFSLPRPERDAPAQSAETPLEFPTPLQIPSTLWQRFVGVLLTASLIVSVLTKEGRDRFIAVILWLVPLGVMIYGYTLVLPVIRAWILSFQNLLRSQSEAPVLQFISTIPPTLILLTSLLLAVAVVLIGWFFVRSWQRRRVLNSVSAEARTALADIEAGAELRHVIIEAYHAMTVAVSTAHGVSRRQNATPREFEQKLSSIGLPQAPIQRLTHLFEQVRYGGQALGADSRSEAQACLQAIIDACEGEV